MGKMRWFAGVPLGAALVLTVPALPTGMGVAASAATAVVADWELNDAPGSTVMVDRTGKHNGTISPDAAAAGLTLDGSTYNWSLRCPACPPPALPRVVQVPDSSALDIPDPNVTQSIEFRFRTPKGYGNIMQKGQATATGGQIKIENPNGLTQCVYVGANGKYVAVASPIHLNDNLWHIFKCVHTASQIQVWVDGAQVAVRNFVTGPIDNSWPFVVGGKSSCDQVKVTCDYYTGQLDWIRVVTGAAAANLPPTATFTSTCSSLTCTFDGSGSSDPEGQALSYAWTFGDGSSSTAAKPSHTFATAGRFTVTLTVTDPAGNKDALSRDVDVGQASGTVAFRAAASSNTNTIAPSVTIPSTVRPGDALVLVASTNRFATLSTPAGWTLLRVQTDAPDLESWVFTRTAPTGAAGSRVGMSLDAYSKASLTLLAYSGAGAVSVTAAKPEAQTSTTAHQSPPVTVATAGSFVVSSWVDKTSSGNGGWTVPTVVTVRNTNSGAPSGVVTAVTGDSGPVPAGTWSGRTATAGVASGKAIGWSIVVPPA